MNYKIKPRRRTSSEKFDESPLGNVWNGSGIRKKNVTYSEDRQLKSAWHKLNQKIKRKGEKSIVHERKSISGTRKFKKQNKS